MHRYGMNILQRQPSDYILNIPGVRCIEPASPWQGYTDEEWRAF